MTKKQQKEKPEQPPEPPRNAMSREYYVQDLPPFRHDLEALRQFCYYLCNSDSDSDSNDHKDEPPSELEIDMAQEDVAAGFAPDIETALGRKPLPANWAPGANSLLFTDPKIHDLLVLGLTPDTLKDKAPIYIAALRYLMITKKPPLKAAAAMQEIRDLTPAQVVRILDGVSKATILESSPDMMEKPALFG